jgi:hypothetical protein
MTNTRMESIWKEVVVAYITVLSQHLPERSEENHQGLCSLQPISGLRFKLESTEIRNGSAKQLAVLPDTARRSGVGYCKECVTQ